MRVTANQPPLTSAQIYENARIKGVKKIKMCRIPCKLGSVKKISREPSHTNVNILKLQILAKKCMKINCPNIFFHGRILYI